VSASDVAGNTTNWACAYSVSYVVGLGYDPRRPFVAEQPAAIIVFLRDAKGTTVSKATVTAAYVTDASTGKTLAPTSAGSNSANRVFTPLANGGFEYDLVTTGYSAGRYSLALRIGPPSGTHTLGSSGTDPKTHLVPFTFGTLLPG
jgi:hypothetical protein